MTLRNAISKPFRREQEFLVPLKQGQGIVPYCFHGTPVRCRLVLDVPTGEVAGVSAAPAWTEPVGGSLHPMEAPVFPMWADSLTHGGLPPGVVGSVCREFSAWTRDGGAPGLLCVSVGPVPGKAALDDATGLARDFLAGLGMEPSRLVFFFQCAGLKADPMTTLHAFLALKRMGVRLGVDLCDIEHPPYHFLEMLPVDFLRVGREADAGSGDVAAFGEKDGFRDRLADVCAFAGNLLMDVIVAGVDSAALYRTVSGLGCRFAQGAFFTAVSPSGKSSGLFDTNGVSSGL